VSPDPRARRAARVAVAVALLLLPLALFHRALFFGEAFVPADLLGYVAPWSHTRTSPPETAWNVLRFDGAAEFYPWRLEAARQIRAGRIPLWNDHAFAAHGGTPLLADSQSAPLYPPNALFYLMPPGSVWYAFGLTNALHLLIAAVGLYLLLRASRLGRMAAVLGAATFALSGPVVTWLSLPTFLAVTCWIPWLLLLVRYAHKGAGTRTGRLAGLGAGAVAGTMLLAGHLQMAFYGLLAAGLYAIWLGVGGLRAGNVRPVGWVAGSAGALTLAVLLALPQVLPALELSRVSHRAVDAARPTMEAYNTYVANALPVRNLVTLLVPDFFGHPNPAGTLYWNTNNYGEWAAYVGIAPLLLAVFALALPWRGPTSARRSGRGFWAALSLVALSLAMGTPLNLPLFFLVPGYSQTGNPARSLALVALALAALTAYGLDGLLDTQVEIVAKRRAGLIALVALMLVAAIGAGQAAKFAGEELPQVPFGQLTTAAMPGVLLALVLLVLTAALLFGLPATPERYRPLGGGLLAALAALDLFAWGAGYNPTVPHEQVYPVTPGIAFLQQNGRDALIAPLNRRWSLGLFDKRPPQGAVLPPNTLTVFGLHDIAGYDSLFPATAKAQVKDAGGGEDPSPQENGNLVFVKSAEAAVALGARYLVLAPDARIPLSVPGLREAYRGKDLVIWENPAGRNFDATRGRAYQPDSFRVGLFCGLSALSALAATLTTAGLTARRRRTVRITTAAP
jgi:hypothetical protein